MARTEKGNLVRTEKGNSARIEKTVDPSDGTRYTDCIWLDLANQADLQMRLDEAGPRA